MLQSLKYYLLQTIHGIIHDIIHSRYNTIICNANLRKCSLFVKSPKMWTIKCRTETLTQFNKHIFATVVKPSKVSI